MSPWDLTYRPTSAAGLDNYYLWSTREPHSWWRDDDPTTGTDTYPRDTSDCQDYGVAFNCDATTGAHLGTPRTRSTEGFIYQWLEIPTWYTDREPRQ